MRYLLLLQLLLVCLFDQAQQSNGIKFEEKELTWKDVKQKAKNKSKYIFIDAYTTWCGPCKYMSKNIFPQKEVGDFFNENFISIALQIDTTKNDNKIIKRWYKDAAMISDIYKISVFPTYLFLNQDGVLMHTITGASENKDDFIAKAKNAINPLTQYATLKEAFENGRRDSSFLTLLIKTARDASDDSLLHACINYYLTTQNNLLSTPNISLIAEGTSKSSDEGFDILLNHPKEVGAVIGKDRRTGILNTIAFDEEIFPLIMINGKKTVYGGGLSIYGGGEMNKSVDWDAITTTLNLKYGDLSKSILLNGKLKYYDWLEDWENFNDLLLDYKIKEADIDTNLIGNMAYKLIANCEDTQSFRNAIGWASILAADKKNPYSLKIYSKILYLAGENDMAIDFMKEYLQLTNKSDKSGEIIEKMRKGEKIE
ncbi:MAG TPA: thioredoxin family protein [Agriterribacter sp.]|nr:thioredoxin family protein [Agriterribacter sp.]